jgi:hypothetical protein
MLSVLTSGEDDEQSSTASNSAWPQQFMQALQGDFFYKLHFIIQNDDFCSQNRTVILDFDFVVKLRSHAVVDS